MKTNDLFPLLYREVGLLESDGLIDAASTIQKASELLLLYSMRLRNAGLPTEPDSSQILPSPAPMTDLLSQMTLQYDLLSAENWHASASLIKEARDRLRLQASRLQAAGLPTEPEDDFCPLSDIRTPPCRTTEAH